MSKEIRKILDLTPADDNKVEVIVPDKAEEDFDFVRQTHYELLNKASEALEDMIDISRSSQSYKDYNALTNLIKTAADVSHDLLEIHKQRREISGDIAPQTVNNNLFVGTTADMNKIIEDRRKRPSNEE